MSFVGASFDVGPEVNVGLARLIDTRALIQAASGAGKSWLLRRILEQTHGLGAQQIVIDPEGEFASLREKYDYVLAGKGGDCAADPRSAALLAEKLWSLQVSAIIDIYELKAHERIRFVRLFCEALMEQPKENRHPTLVVVDEAHLFCPEGSEAESRSAVVDLVTRGRKRGLCAVLATQRLSKLHKDAAAELGNRMVGRTTLDIDVKRASDLLGFTDRAAARSIMELKDGEFYCWGPAMALRPVTLAHVGPVQTKHPKAGARLAVTIPPPTAEVKKLLPQLADLPAEVEERADALLTFKLRSNELAQENRDLRRKLEAVPAPAAPEKVYVAVGPPEVVTRLEHVIRELESIESVFGSHLAMAKGLLANNGRLSPPPTLARPAASVQPINGRDPDPTRTRQERESLSGPERKILTALAQYGPCSIRKLALLTSYAASGGAFKNPLGRLRSAQLVTGKETVALTHEGNRVLGSWSALPTGPALIDHWEARLSGPERKLFRALADSRLALSAHQLAERCGYEPTGGAFKNPLGRLRTLGLIVGRQELSLSEDLL